MDKTLKFAIFAVVVLAASAEAASGTTGTSSYFQPLWNVLKSVLGDTYIGYIAAAAGAGMSAQRWFENLPTATVIKPIVIGGGFGSFTALAEALAGAMI